MLEVEPAFLYKQMENFLNLTKLGASTWEEVRIVPRQAPKNLHTKPPITRNTIEPQLNIPVFNRPLNSGLLIIQGPLPHIDLAYW